MNLLQNSIYFRNIFFFRKNWSLFAVEHKTYHNPPEKNINSNKYTFGAPWLLDLLSYKHWFMSSVRNFCHWSTDVPCDEKSLATRSKEKQLYLQASLWLYEPRRSWDWLTKMQKEKKQGQYSSIVTEQEKVYFMTKKKLFSCRTKWRPILSRQKMPIKSCPLRELIRTQDSSYLC